jgi:hypothetical protein
MFAQSPDNNAVRFRPKSVRLSYACSLPNEFPPTADSSTRLFGKYNPVISTQMHEGKQAE